MPSDLNKLPPLALWRMVLCLLLVALGLLGLWAELHGKFDHGMPVLVFSFYGVVSLTGILNWQPKGDIKPLHSILMITSFMAFLALLWFDWDLPAWARPALSQPAVFIAGWGITSALLVWHWWKRRDNTQHLSDEWKPLSR